MNKSIALITGVFSIIIILITLPSNIAHSQVEGQQAILEKPPEQIKGGEWHDDFWFGQLLEAQNIDVQVSHLYLKYKEQLHWTQTWTAQFALGEFFHTEAVDDSVRLEHIPETQNFYETGTYTSTVFYAGKAVDWAAMIWRYSGVPDGLVLETRNGNTPIPDNTWTAWQSPEGGFMEYYCAYTFNSDATECFSNMIRVESSIYIQYRATFKSSDSTKTISFYDIDITYGIHCLTGYAVSIPISPVDLRAWNKVELTATIPALTSMVIDITAPDGTLLVTDVKDGTSLAGIDPRVYPALQFRVNLTTTDESITPDIDLWGLRWQVMYRSFIPVTIR